MFGYKVQDMCLAGLCIRKVLLYNFPRIGDLEIDGKQHLICSAHARECISLCFQGRRILNGLIYEDDL